MMARTISIILIVSTVMLSAQSALSLEDFPEAALPGNEIGSGLASGYEPSGAVWHTGLDQLLVVSDNGDVSRMNADGTNVTNWNVSGDLEAICVADPSSPFVYVGVEHPDSIFELNINTGFVTRTFDLTPWMSGTDNKGLEALTFLPDTEDAEGGIFYAGLQDDGKIYAFRLAIATSTTSTTVTFLRRFIGTAISRIERA